MCISALVLFCERLFNPTNGTKLTNETAVGTVVYFECSNGLILRGAPNITCRPDGTWSASEPICEGGLRLERKTRIDLCFCSTLKSLRVTGCSGERDKVNKRVYSGDDGSFLVQ